MPQVKEKQVAAAKPKNARAWARLMALGEVIARQWKNKKSALTLLHEAR